jgi:hypothetical protein
MKKCIIEKVPFTLSFAISCLLIVLITLNAGCKKIVPEAISNTSNTAKTANASMLREANELLLDTIPITQQLVIWKKPDNTSTDNAISTSTKVTMAAFDKWIIDFKHKYPGTQEITCKNCLDSTLKLLVGPNVLNFIQTNTVSGNQTGSTTNATGENDTLYFCINFKVRRPGKLLNSVKRTYKPKSFSGTGTPVNVAVLDTGIDTSGLRNYLYQPTNSACIPGANKGWNFVANNPNYLDDNNDRHGTSVTYFAIDQVAKSTSINTRPIRVLPVKTNDNNGVGDLFSMLCGFAYAKERKVKIINASIGFPEPRLELYYTNNNVPNEPNTLLLEEFVKYYLTNNNILLVAAAGNLDPKLVNQAFDFNHIKNYPTDYRNLDQFHFMPASLSRKLWNVIAVTTVDTIKPQPKTVSPEQNFSPNVVDIGVMADKIIGTSLSSSYIFNNADPLAPFNGYSNGSSFATPCVAGKLCAKYTQVSSVLNTHNKSQILDIITGGKSQDLNKSIKAGRYVNK